MQFGHIAQLNYNFQTIWRRFKAKYRPFLGCLEDLK